VTVRPDPSPRPTTAWPDRRWVVGLIISRAIITGVSVVTNKRFTQLTDASQRLQHSYQALYQIERLTSELKDAASQQRGYLLTGDELFLGPYDADTKSVAGSLVIIRSLTTDDPDQLRRLNALEPLIAETMNLLGQTIQMRQSSSRAALNPDSLRQTGTLMAQIDSLAGQMTDAENRLFHDRDEAAKYQASLMAEIELGGSLLSVLIIAAIFYLMSREIGRRRQTEETLQNLNVALEQRVTTRTTELRREVAERRRAEGRLQSTSAFLDAVIENVPAMIFVKDADSGRFVLLNRFGEDLLGYDRRDVIGKTDYDIFPKEQADRLVARDRDVLVSRQALVTPEEAITTRIRGVRLLRTTEVAVPDQTGAMRYLVGFSEDISERREIEQQLRHALKMEAVGQLTGGVAHDFNNLLGIIIGNLDLVLDAVKGDRALKEIAQAALDGALRGAEVTQRLLAFSRRQPLQPMRINLNDRLLQVVPMLRRTLGDPINIQLHTAPELWSVQVDSSQTDTAILNLAVNSRDAMPQGGVLRIETANVHLDSAYASRHLELHAGDYVRLTVEDTGVGIPPPVLERVFEPFFTTKGTGKGTGLGLSMVYGFVKQSGGHIKIDSEVGHGTSVKIYLPRAAATGADEAGRDAQLRGPAAGGELILVVEDNEGMRAVTAKQLSGLGYRVLEADSGSAALKILDGNREIALLFSDVMMPGGMTGYDLAKEARLRRPDLPILLTTGYATEAAAAEAPTIDRLQLLMKPYRMNDLEDRLRQVLEHQA
jgi:PAS domain S-box-containing protein